ncbi:MAG: DUF1287 domain-containing protein [Rhodanobacteraceae bacterium]|nr:DUF1287 domain-containing protein [Rhodanobacteraceae bacterium]
MRTALRRLVAAWLLAAAPVIAIAQESGLQCLVDASREQIGVTLHYDPTYVRLAYPGGDVPPERGVCTDVLVRAWRRLGIDLQRLVHEDMRAHFARYPQNWGLRAPDRNIDHRRVPNLATFFSRHGQSLGTAGEDAEFLPGDLVTWRLPSGVPHIGIVSDRKSASGTPLVVHNIGAGTREEDMLRGFQLTGHFRYRPAALPEACSRGADDR